MPHTIDLKAAPFNLDDQAIAWVRQTLGRLSPREKIGQLFTLASRSNRILDQRELLGFAPGGIFRPVRGSLEEIWRANRFLADNSELPLLISGDIEGGGASYLHCTPLPNPLGLAAADDPQLSARVLEVMAGEARALGYNWSFTPLLDINARFRSAIVGTRSYGSEQRRILEQARLHVDILQRHGIATAAKHWPGEGFDDRDQHLVGTVNPLSWEDWQTTFGALYKGLIDAGVLSVMSAHIALPAYIRRHLADAGRDAFQPASASALLNRRLLREELGFNGLIISDATGMAGLSSWHSRAELVPAVIESGCDVFLFTQENPSIDFDLMYRGLREGRLSEERLEQAVTRILALKARLGLHRALRPPIALDELRRVLQSAPHRAVAEEAAAASITLVKDRQRLLPISLEKHRRIVLASEGVIGHPTQLRPELHIARLLAERGFEVSDYDPEDPPSREKNDLLIYVLAEESATARAHIYLNWQRIHGGNIRDSLRRHWHDLPTLVISLGQPYYLYDAPLIPTYINAYSAIEPVQRAVIAKLLGEQAFIASDPVDSFCGLEEARY